MKIIEHTKWCPNAPRPNLARNIPSLILITLRAATFNANLQTAAELVQKPPKF